jgi:DNA-binding transcriptional regulator YiaG
MTPQEYRRTRERLDLTQSALADLLGVRLNTISRRELGRIKIEREAELALRFVAMEVERKGRAKK